MTLYALHNNASDWHRTTSFFQTVMFHGEAVVPPDRTGVASHDPGEVACEPMRLVVNAHRPADVFLPFSSCNLVVSERVARRLEPLRANFELWPVAFEKVYTLPWNADGDTVLPPRLDGLRRAGRERSVTAACPHDPGVAAALPPYFEVVAPNHYPLQKRFPPTHRFLTTAYWFENEPCDDDHLPVSRELFAEYPVTSPGYPVVRGDVFEALAPFLDRPFFGVKGFEFEAV